MNPHAAPASSRYTDYLSEALPLGEVWDLATGVEARLVFDALHWKSPSADFMTSELAISSEVGMMLEAGWRWTPEEAGAHDWAIRFHSTVQPDRLEQQSLKLRVHDSAAWAAGRAGKPLRWLPIGDSITATGAVQWALVERANCFGAVVEPLGTQARQPEGGLEVRHEGYPGWKFVDFIRRRTPQPGANPRLESEPPFLSGDELDFPGYVQRVLGGEEPEVITVSLGTNDIALLTGEGLEEGIEEALGHAETLIDHLIASTRQAHIGLAAPILPAPGEDAFGLNYGCLIPHWRYRKNQHVMARALYERFAWGRERVSVIPMPMQVDPAAAYPTQEDRRTIHDEAARVVVCNSVHPVRAGARQMADSIFGWMVGKTA